MTSLLLPPLYWPLVSRCNRPLVLGRTVRDVTFGTCNQRIDYREVRSYGRKTSDDWLRPFSGYCWRDSAAAIAIAHSQPFSVTSSHHHQVIINPVYFYFYLINCNCRLCWPLFGKGCELTRKSNCGQNVKHHHNYHYREGVQRDVINVNYF